MAYRWGCNVLLCLGLFVIASCHCTRLTNLKVYDKLKVNLTLGPAQVKRNEWCYGRLIIGQNSLQATPFKGSKAVKNLQTIDADYQADGGAYFFKTCLQISMKFSIQIVNVMF